MWPLHRLNALRAALVTTIIGAEYMLGWLLRGTHQWRRFVRPDELHLLLQRDGLHVQRHTGVGVNPLTRQLSLCRSERVNSMLSAARVPPATAP